MKTFKDKDGNIWTLQLTLGKVRQLAGKLGTDLLKLEHQMAVLDSLTERLAFVTLLCEEQAIDRNIDANQFDSLLFGKGVANSASDAFLGEYASLCRNLGQEAMAITIDKAMDFFAASRSRLDGMVNSGQIASSLEASFQKSLDQIDRAGKLSPNSPPSPESTGSP